jgi:hypothetical protein
VHFFWKELWWLICAIRVFATAGTRSKNTLISGGARRSFIYFIIFWLRVFAVLFFKSHSETPPFNLLILDFSLGGVAGRIRENGTNLEPYKIRIFVSQTLLEQLLPADIFITMTPVKDIVWSFVSDNEHVLLY